MPKGAKKRAKLKKKQEGSHPAGSNGGANNGNNNNGNSNNGNNSSRRDAASDGNHLPIPLNIPPVDMSEDSMESSEEMVTPRAEADEEEKKATTSEVPVERAVEVVEENVTGEAGEEVMVDALPPEAGEREQEGSVDAKAKAHVVVQEPEVQDVVVSEAPELVEPEVKNGDVVVRETAKVHPAHEPEHKGEDTKGDGVVPRFSEASSADTTEVLRGPAVAVAASGHRATWWNCCGVFDAFAGSER